MTEKPSPVKPLEFLIKTTIASLGASDTTLSSKSSMGRRTMWMVRMHAMVLVEHDAHNASVGGVQTNQIR